MYWINKAIILLAVAGASASVRPAFAQTFPEAKAWRALNCARDQPITDARGDSPNAGGGLDLVGTTPAAAAFRASDATFLYVRIRLDATPLAGTRLAHAWGIALDLDATRTNYELLLTASGVAPEAPVVSVYRNTSTTLSDDLADPADVPPAFEYPFATHGRVVDADSSTGGDLDSFLDLAVPWRDLASVGLKPTTPVFVWVGSSTVPNALDRDVACHDGGSGAAHPSQIAVERTTLDPVTDSDGDGSPDANEIASGTNPNDAQSRPAPDSGGNAEHTLEGGPGCSAEHATWLALLVNAALLVRMRRRRSGATSISQDR